MSQTTRRRLLIIGAGSSGLITLKYALDVLPGWQIDCFEKSKQIVGCWGRPYDGFVSTTTKFATQFAAMPEFDADFHQGDAATSEQFFRDGEYGDYLTRFADRFGLAAHIGLQHQVNNIARAADGDGWFVDYENEGGKHREKFSAIVICTGLVGRAKSIDIDHQLATCKVCSHRGQLESASEGQTFVVCGSGESAVDTANRLSDPQRNHRVYLSLRSGIRLSPRYHPIRGVPSDYLRTRLMLSVNPDWRNRLGDWFVKARIRFGSVALARSSKGPPSARLQRQSLRGRGWAARLHIAARDDLFDMFHNKSDTFMQRVAQGRIRLIGSPTDASWKRFHRFENPDRQIDIDVDYLVPAIGFHSSISELFDQPIELTQFYLGCVHSVHRDLFAVGFARPVIGNIPSISEMQAKLVSGLIAEQYARPQQIQTLCKDSWNAKRERFKFLTKQLPAVYPVEMFAYCDRLAAWMDGVPADATAMRIFANMDQVANGTRDDVGLLHRSA